MTHLQQTCADMVVSHEGLQIVYSVERRMQRAKVSAEVRERVRQARVAHERLGHFCADMLAVNFPAANDAVNLPGAA